jgi:hypothetical protein
VCFQCVHDVYGHKCMNLHVFSLHTLMYKQKFASLHFFISPSLVAVGWGSFAWVERAVLLWW